MNNNFYRGRRLRKDTALRDLFKENHLLPTDFIVPIFLEEGKGIKNEIPSMPDYFTYSLDTLLKEVGELWQMGIRSVLLFVKVEDQLKDNKGTEALNPDGLMQRGIKAIKNKFPEMIVMTDVALDPYSSFGHDGVVEEGKILNDPTVEVLSEMAISHAKAGADIVAPSDMMDGRVLNIRAALDQNGFIDTGIMSYTAKYASSFYGPFRDALDSAPGFGDKKTYQMNPANRKVAFKEAEADTIEGADILMVKPGLPYLDIVRDLANNFDLPIASYQVSGEYAMIKSAALKGWLNEEEAIKESLISFKRAGATLIATYFAKRVCSSV